MHYHYDYPCPYPESTCTYSLMTEDVQHIQQHYQAGSIATINGIQYQVLSCRGERVPRFFAEDVWQVTLTLRPVPVSQLAQIPVVSNALAQAYHEFATVPDGFTMTGQTEQPPVEPVKPQLPRATWGNASRILDLEEITQ